jgi:adenosylcobinamide-GDP ribazoletransferase
MKDSRLGTYGAVALLLCLALQASSLSVLPAPLAAACLLAAHATGRLAPVLIMARMAYAGDAGASRIEHRDDRLRAGEVAVAVTIAALPFLLLPVELGIAGLALGAGAAALASWRLCRTLGGYTGDVLGATVAVFQTFFLLGAAAGLGS